MKGKFLLLILLCVVLLTACSSNTTVKKQSEQTAKTYDSYVVDMANDGLITDAEKDWWLGLSSVENTAEGERIVTFNGEEHVVTYRDSFLSGYSHIQLDRYQNDEVIISFSSTDGSFRGIHFKNLIDEDYLARAEVTNPYENARDMAAKIASQYIQVDSYILEETVAELPPEELSSELSLYTFHYVKSIGDFKTGDELYVQITSKGDIRIINIGDIGCFDSIQSTQIDSHALMQSLLARLEELYSGVGSYTYEIVNQTMAYNPDGQLTIVSQIELHVESGIGEGYDTGVVLATVVDSTENGYCTS